MAQEGNSSERQLPVPALSNQALLQRLEPPDESEYTLQTLRAAVGAFDNVDWSDEPPPTDSDPEPSLFGTAMRWDGSGNACIDTTAAATAMQRSSGAPLPRALGMDLGWDEDMLSGIRLHADAHAGAAARALQGGAFALGEDIFVDPAAVSLSSELGRRVLGEELAHVAQFRAGQIRSGGALSVSDPSSTLEREAAAVATGSGPQPGAASMGSKGGSGVAHRWTAPGAATSGQTQISPDGFLVLDDGRSLQVERAWWRYYFEEVGPRAAAMLTILEALAAYHPEIGALSPDDLQLAAQLMPISPHFQDGRDIGVANVTHMSPWVGRLGGPDVLWRVTVAPDATFTAIAELRLSPSADISDGLTPEMASSLLDALEQQTVPLDPTARADLQARQLGGQSLFGPQGAIVILDQLALTALAPDYDWGQRVVGSEEGEEPGAPIASLVLTPEERATALRFLRALGVGQRLNDSDAERVRPEHIQQMIGLMEHPRWQWLRHYLRSHRTEATAVHDLPMSEVLSRWTSVMDARQASSYGLDIDAHAEGDDVRLPIRVPASFEDLSGPLYENRTGRFRIRVNHEEQEEAYRLAPVFWIDVQWTIRDQDGRTVDNNKRYGYPDNNAEGARVLEHAFPEAGVYTIAAYVQHDRFLPVLLQTQVLVHAREDFVEQQEDTGFASSGMGGMHTTTEMDLSHLSDVGHLGTDAVAVSRGWMTPVTEELDPNASVEARWAALMVQTRPEDLEAMLQQLQGTPAASETDAEARRDAIERVREAIAERDEDTAHAESQTLIIHGTFIPELNEAQPDHMQLEAVAWFSERSWHVAIHDFSGINGPDIARVEGTQSTFRDAALEALLALAKTYSRGTVSARVEELNDHGTRNGRWLGGRFPTNDAIEATLRAAYNPVIQGVVNIVGTIGALFPPTSGFAVPALLTYNATGTGLQVAQHLESGTLGNHRVLVAQLLADVVVPAAARRLVGTLGGRAYSAIDVGSQVVLLTGDAWGQLQDLKEQHIVAAAQIYAQIAALERTEPNHPNLPALRAQFLEARERTQTAWATVADGMVANGGIMLLSSAVASRLRAELEGQRQQRIHEYHQADPTGRASDSLTEATLAAGLDAPVRFVDGSSVRVAYGRGRLGGTRAIEVLVGRDASVGMVRGHASTVQALQRLQHVAGLLRTRAARRRGEGDVGSADFEARLELQKLAELEAFLDTLRGEVPDSAMQGRIERQTEAIRQQLAREQTRLGDHGPGQQSVNVDEDVLAGPQSPDDLMQDGRFLNADLEQLYQQFLNRNPGADSPRSEWAQHQTNGRPADILNDALPAGWRTGGARPETTPVRIDAIGNRSGLTDAEITTYLQTLSESADTWQRMQALDPAQLANGEVSGGLLNILYGNIGEVLGHGRRQEALQGIQATIPDAVLERQVRMFTVDAQTGLLRGHSVLFSDDCIVVPRGEDLQILRVFETKAGNQGAHRAERQVFEWGETRLEDGVVILLEDGRMYQYQPDGTGTLDAVIPEGHPAYSGDNGAQLGRVTGLHGAPRELHVTAGTVGPGSEFGDRGGVRTDVEELPVTAEQLRFLAQLLLRSRAGT